RGENGSAVAADWRVLTFAVAVSLATGVLFGLIPAIQACRADLISPLKESSGPSGSGLRQNKTHSVLVAAEVALALMLLVGSGLLIRTFLAMRSVNLGFERGHVLTRQMSLTGARHQKTAGEAQAARLDQ